VDLPLLSGWILPVVIGFLSKTYLQDFVTMPKLDSFLRAAGALAADNSLGSLLVEAG
jgi:hypothetical protein